MYTESKTIGWQPTCKCGETETIPCLVLDPFNGAATTGITALNLGRDYVGIDLNEEYLKMSIERIRKTTDKPTIFQAERHSEIVTSEVVNEVA